MKRVAILGATGSVGAQALAVCAADPQLQVVALAGGRNADALRAAAAAARRRPARPRLGRRPRRHRPPRRGVRRRRRAERHRRRGRPRRLARRAPLRRRPGPRQQGVAGRRRARWCWPRWPRSGRRLLPVDSEHSALLQCTAGDARRRDPVAGADRVRRTVPRPHGRRPARRRPGRRARAPDLGHGREDHDRLGDADEQGPRGDRGALPVRPAVRPHRGRGAPAVDRPRHGADARRRADRARRAPRHARAHRLRAHVPGPLRHARRRSSTCRGRCR